MRSEPLRRAIEKFGTVTAFAHAIGVRPQAISQWGDIPVHRVAAVEAITNIPRHELRPDLWDPPAERQSAA